MLKFFRAIRQNLLSENKFNKYLIYAIGEIVLVVIGILIALSINSWNEEIKNKRSEIHYLNRIANDLENDISEFELTKETAKKRNERVLFLLDALKDVELVQKSPDYFVTSIVIAGYSHRPSISNHSFEELKSSGRLSLIQNEELRVSITKYYNFVFNQSQWKFISEDVQLKYNEYSAGILNHEQLSQVISRSDTLNISKMELQEIFKRFSSKKEFHSFLPRTFEDKYEFIVNMNNSKKEAENLKIKIQTELSQK